MDKNKEWDWNWARHEHDLEMRRAGWLNFDGTCLHKEDLSGRNLRGCSFRHASLWEADLSDARCYGADFSYASLHGAKLHGTDLSDVTFEMTDVDFACLPLWCGGLHMNVDLKFMAQLAYHFHSMNCDNLLVKEAQLALRPLARFMHRTDVSRVGVDI